MTEVRDDRAGSEVRARANDAVTNVREMRNPGVGEQDAVFHLYAVTDVAVFPQIRRAANVRVRPDRGVAGDERRSLDDHARADACAWFDDDGTGAVRRRMDGSLDGAIDPIEDVLGRREEVPRTSDIVQPVRRQLRLVVRADSASTRSRIESMSPSIGCASPSGKSIEYISWGG